MEEEKEEAQGAGGGSRGTEEGWKEGLSAGPPLAQSLGPPPAGNLVMGCPFCGRSMRRPPQSWAVMGGPPRVFEALVPEAVRTVRCDAGGSDRRRGALEAGPRGHGARSGPWSDLCVESGP